ncbi:MAG: phosphotransferase family protein [Pseudomonadota bacterium]
MNEPAFSQIVRRLFPDADIASVASLTGGVSADVYRIELKSPDDGGGDLVLRVHGESHSGHTAALEYRLLQSLFRLGLPVPEPLRVDETGGILGSPYLVMAYVAGSSKIPDDSASHYIRQMADLLHRIHALPIDSLPGLPSRTNPLPEVLDYLPATPEWEELRSYLIQLPNTAYTGTPRLLHGDFWPENLLWQDGTIASILDWEDAAIGDPLSDVACCRLELRYKFGTAGMDEFTRQYMQGKAVDTQRLALWQVYVAAAALRFMGDWGLAQDLLDHMRGEALACVRESARVLLSPVGDRAS